MGMYFYKGINSSGKELAGQISAESEILAKQKIKSLGIRLISLSEKGSKSQGSSGAGSWLRFGQGKVDIKDLSLMTRQLATLIKARVQVVDALSALVNQVDSEVLKIALSDVKTRVNEGSSVAKAMSHHKQIFDNIYVNMVEAGEASGTLDLVLIRLAEFKEAQVRLKNKVSGAMTYPLLMASFGSLVLGGIFIFIVPQFANLLKSQKKELPAITEYTLMVSEFLQAYWWGIIIAAVTLFFLLKRYLATTEGKRNFDLITLKLPTIGPLVTMVNVSRFCSTLGTLLSSGVPILASMGIVKNLLPNILLQETIEQCRVSISEGSSMTGPLIESGHFPSMVTHMIRLGENSGELETMLNIIAETYKDEVDNKISGLTSLLEPVMILFMAVIVGVVVMAVILPMLSMMKMR